MNEVTIKITRKQAAPILAAVSDYHMGNYNGRKFKVVFTDRVTFNDTNWSGGTKNDYAFVRSDGKTAHLSVPAPWDNIIEGMTVAVVPEWLIVERSYFCGSDLGIRIYAHPCHLPKWLPGGNNAS